MKISNEATNEAILREVGARLVHVRLGKNLTQAQVAERAGVSKRTVERLETGGAAPQLAGFIGICRALGLVERIDLLVPERDGDGEGGSSSAAAVAATVTGTGTNVAGGWKRRRASAARGAPREESGIAPRKEVERRLRAESVDGTGVGAGDGEAQAAASVVVVAHELN